MKNFIKVIVLLFIIVTISFGFTKNKSIFILGDPIPGVDVSLEQIPGGVKGVAKTDANGNYDFKNLTAGVYKIHFGPKKSFMNKPYSKAKNKILNSRIAVKEEGVNYKNNNKPNGGSPGHVIQAEDHNSSRSNLSNIVYHGQTVLQIRTKLIKSKLNLKESNIQITIKLTKPIKVLKGLLTY